MCVFYKVIIGVVSLDREDIGVTYLYLFPTLRAFGFGTWMHHLYMSRQRGAKSPLFDEATGWWQKCEGFLQETNPCEINQVKAVNFRGLCSVDWVFSVYSPQYLIGVLISLFCPKFGIAVFIPTVGIKGLGKPKPFLLSLSLFSSFLLQVSHDFAVNFNEDNPECAGRHGTLEESV